jgi:sortase A
VRPRSKVPERALFAAGIALLVFFAFARLSSAFLRARDVRRFDEAAASATPAEPRTGGALVRTDAPRVDTNLWSPERKKAYEESQAAPGGIPLAVLAIPRLHLEVPVLAGTDDLTLNRAVGLIEGTARPGEFGNVGIAGHRDGFFRTLKDIAPGDRITLRTPAGRRDYAVKTLRVVEPDDVSVLDDGPGEVLTLVTCYPFYYVGNAPRRFIVRAE